MVISQKVVSDLPDIVSLLNNCLRKARGRFIVQNLSCVARSFLKEAQLPHLSRGTGFLNCLGSGMVARIELSIVVIQIRHLFTKT